jgi:hypothetical protein
MSAARSLAGLIVVTLAIFAAILAGDSGNVGLVSRETLTLGLLATAELAVQSALAWRGARGQATPVIFVREGAVRRSSSQAPGNDRLRSVSLAVESGQAVVVERNGLFSRILGPGLSLLQPGETVYKVVSTLPRSLIGKVTCATREGITVIVDFEVSAQLKPGSGEKATRGARPNPAQKATSAQLPPAEPGWSEDALVRAAYETHSWQTAVLSLARSSLREQFARSYLSDLQLPAISPGGAIPLETIESRSRRQAAAASSHLGISIQALRVVHLGLPPQLAQGDLSIRTAPPSVDEQRPASLEDDGMPSQTRTAIRLASVLAGGPFATFRQAMRARTDEVTVPDVLLEGRRWVGRALGRADSTPFEMLPDRVHYDIQVHGPGFEAAGLHDGDHLLFASLPEPGDGDIVAVLVDGQVELRRFWQKADHVLLEPERESQPLIAVPSGGAAPGSLRAQYGGSVPAIEIRQASSVKILGRAAIAFQPEAEASRESANRVAPKTEPYRCAEADTLDSPAPPAADNASDTDG